MALGTVDVVVVVVVEVDVEVLDVEVGDVLVVDVLDVLGVELLDADVSSVMPTVNVAFGSTTSTCGSRFRRRTSAVSSSATKPFTLLENTSFTSLPSDVSLFTFAETLAACERMTT